MNEVQMRRRIRSIWATCDQEGRDATLSERAEIEELLTTLEGRKSASRGWIESDPYGRTGMLSGVGAPGDVFIQSKGYRDIRDPSSRPQSFSSGVVEVSTAPLSTKGTLLEAGVGGPGGGLVPPYYEPGIVSKLLEPLGVADVFGQTPTTASQVRYIVEGTATSGAGGVAEGALKPESTLAYSETTEAVRKIATFLPVSDELLEDAPSLSGYLNGRLGLFIKVEEERQLLRGVGSGSNELLGIFGRSGINQFTKLASDDNAVTLAKVIANTRGSSFLQPDTVVLHPVNWLSTRLLRDGTGGTVGNFYGGGPFGAAYGGGPGISPALFGESIWNTRVVLSTVVGAGTALVGNFGQAAMIWRRGGVTLEASNSHSDFFQRNMTALRAEERLGLGIYRPGAFTEIRGLT